MAADLYCRIKYRCLIKESYIAIALWAEAVGMPIRLEDGRSGVIRHARGFMWSPGLVYDDIELTVEVEPVSEVQPTGQ